MTKSFTVDHERYEPADPRLGRHVMHDSRSLAYKVEAAPLSELKSIRHKSHIPVLNQGKIGSCVGNAVVGCLGHDYFWNTPKILSVLSATNAETDEKYALSVYSEATIWDPFPNSYPPIDTGTDGLSGAKIAHKRGLINGYQHATSLEAALTALVKQPIITGTKWLGDMFRPNSQGLLSVTGNVEGGHEYVLDELDVENKLVGGLNSWGPEWGLSGRFYMTWDDFGGLLADKGDVTIFTPLTEPAPQPTPQPAPQPTQDPKAEFAEAAKAFDAALHKFLNS